MPRVVQVRLAGTGRLLTVRADRVAIELPPAFEAASGQAVVVGDVVTYVDACGHAREVRLPTRRLGHFFGGEHCLVPTNERTADGHTAWRAVAIVLADHLRGPGEPLDELP